MRDTWIDEHTGDELSARPAFRAELREQLAEEFTAPARLSDRRRTPWRAIGWASVAAAAMVTTVVVVGNDDDKRVGPGASIGSAEIDPADIVDATWAIPLGLDGSSRSGPLAWFRFESDGPMTGYDSCNDYGSSSWRLANNTIAPIGNVGFTTVGCVPMEPQALAAQQVSIEFGADRDHLTAGEVAAVRLDESTHVTVDQILGAWSTADGAVRLEVTGESALLELADGNVQRSLDLYLVDGVVFARYSAGATIFAFPLEEHGPTDASHVDWVAGEIFGYGIGFHSVDEVSAAISAIYGEPTADTGWYTIQPLATGDEDCLAGREVRVLHWGDLSVAFSKMNAMDGVAGEFLWSWVVGDLRGSGFDSYREPVPAPTGSPTGLLTEGGIGVGSSLDQLRANGDVVLSDFTNTDGTRGGFFTPTVGTDGSSSRSFVIDADGTIIGFGATQSFC